MNFNFDKYESEKITLVSDDGIKVEINFSGLDFWCLSLADVDLEDDDLKGIYLRCDGAFLSLQEIVNEAEGEWQLFMDSITPESEKIDWESIEESREMD